MCIRPDDTLHQHQVQNQDCITITHRLYGGTKDGTCGTTKQTIVDALVAQGQPAQAVATHVEGLVALLTPEQHKSVQSAPDSRQTCAIIRKCAKQHNVALSNLFPTRQNKPKPAVRQLELTDLSIEEGTFLNADGAHAAIGGHFTVAGRGVYTLLPESMQHLPQESKSLCKHELALIVLREPVPAPKRPCEKVVFTALDHTGNKLILAGWMIQFGDGKVSIAKPDRFDVPVPSCTIFAFTMHRDECENPDQWAQLVSKPGKYILQQLEIHPDAVYELWGRSWRTASKQVAPGVAESFRIWAWIADCEVERLLRISGLTSPPVYTETREDHQASSSTSVLPTKTPAFRMLWLPKDTSAMVAGHLGCIRGRTGRGIRIPEAAFDKAWQVFHPNKPQPVQVEAKHRWQLHGAPPRVKSKHINEFLGKLSIKGRTLRKQGQVWIVERT